MKKNIIFLGIFFFLLGAIFSGFFVYIYFGSSKNIYIEGEKIQQIKTTIDDLDVNEEEEQITISEPQTIVDEESYKLSPRGKFCEIKKDISQMDEKEYLEYVSLIGDIYKLYAPKDIFGSLKSYTDCDIIERDGNLTEENKGDCYIDIAIRELGKDSKISDSNMDELLTKNISNFATIKTAFIDKKCEIVGTENTDLNSFCDKTKDVIEHYSDMMIEAKKLLCE